MHLLHDIQKHPHGPTVLLPDNTRLTATHFGFLDFPSLPKEACKAWVLPGLQRSLISVATFTDANLTVNFKADSVQVHDESGTTLLSGNRCTDTLLWKIPLGEQSQFADRTCNYMPSNSRTQQEAVNWAHATMGSPTTSTFMEALRRNYFTIPGVSHAAASKYPPNSLATDMGHLRQKPYKSKQEDTHDDFFPKEIFTRRKTIGKLEYAQANIAILSIPEIELLHADLTGRIPAASRQGNQYILVSFSSYANYTHLEPMKNRTTGEYIRALKATHDFFSTHGIRVEFLRTDNESSKEIAAWCAAQSPPIKMQFVPPGVHRANSSERQIGIVKNHLIAMINSTDPTFPLACWEDLLVQCEITLNLLRQSGISHFMSAYQQLHGVFDNTKTPMAPPGIKVVTHDKADKRASWANRGVEGFYIGPAPKHIGCYTVFIPSTMSTRITDTVSFHPRPGWTLPGASPLDTTNALLEQLDAHFRQHGKEFLSLDRQPAPAPGTLLATLHEHIRLMQDPDGTTLQRVPPITAPPPRAPPGLPPPAPQAYNAAIRESEALAQQLALDAALAQQLALDDAAAIAARTPPEDEATARSLEEKPTSSTSPHFSASKRKRNRSRQKEKKTTDVATPPAPPPPTATAEQAPAAAVTPAKPSTPAPSPKNTKKRTPKYKFDIGFRFSKVFDDATYTGQVIEIGPTKLLRLVRYSDGDEEHISVNEIETHVNKHGPIHNSFSAAAIKTKKTPWRTHTKTPPPVIKAWKRKSAHQQRTKSRQTNAAIKSDAPVQHDPIDRYGHDLALAAELYGLNINTITKSLANGTVNADGVAPLTFKSALQGPDKEIWRIAISTELDKLLTGGHDAVMCAIHAHDLPPGRKVLYYNPQVKQKTLADGTQQHRVRGTGGGNVSDYKGDVSSAVADLTTLKLLLNKVVSNDAYSLCTTDIKDFYLGTPMERKEYMFITREQLPDDIIAKYNLTEHLHHRHGFGEGILVRIDKGIYGLPQAGLLAHNRLNKHLATHGYHQTENTPCLYKHESRDTYFTLIVDDFCTATTSEADRDHFLATLRLLYEIKVDVTARKYIGITIEHNKTERHMKLSVPGYIAAALKRFGIKPKEHRTNAPSPYLEPRYSDKTPQKATVDDSKPVGPAEKKFIQEVVGVLGWYARAVDNTILCAVNKLGSRQAQPTEAVLRDTYQLLDYVATWPDATLVYHPSDMMLMQHSDASWLSETLSRSRASGISMLVKKDMLGDPAAINGAIDCFSTIIKSVVGSAFEAEYAAMYLNGQTAVGHRNTLADLGHPQGATPIIADNACAVGVANRTVKQRRSKAIDMRFHWIRCRVDQGQFIITWAPGSRNLADYFTKSHPAKHHLLMRPLYVEN